MILFRKAILIIHGFAGGTYDEESIANYLEKKWNFDVYSFTLPGHDKYSFRTSRYVEWIDATENMVEMLIGYGYKDIYIIGHSMGGVLACYIAKKYKCVKKLVLAAPAFSYLTESDKTVDKIKSAVKAIKENDTNEILTRFLKLPITSINQFAIFVEEYKDCYREINIPTLIIHGDADTIVPISSSTHIFEELSSKNKKILILDGITHDIFRECGFDTIKEVERFLS